MRPIDADAFREHILGGKPIGLTICQYSESDILEMIREQPTITSLLNDPLTLDELREMDRPVWVECGATPFTPNGGYYCLCQFGKITTPSGSQFDIEEISHWKFYSRKPEEGTT